MANEKRPLGYLGGDIMSFGSNLARQYEYDKIYSWFENQTNS